MKKKIPKFDQKAWDEKQAKSAENYSRGDSSGSFTAATKNLIDRMLERAMRDSFIYGSAPVFIPPATTAAVKSSYDPTTGIYTLGDEYDLNIFDGGEDGQRELPTGHGDDSWYKHTDPAFEKKVICCQPDDKVNIGFHMDKWACKKCGKDM